MPDLPHPHGLAPQRARRRLSSPRRPSRHAAPRHLPRQVLAAAVVIVAVFASCALAACSGSLLSTVTHRPVTATTVGPVSTNALANQPGSHYAQLNAYCNSGTQIECVVTFANGARYRCDLAATRAIVHADANAGPGCESIPAPTVSAQTAAAARPCTAAELTALPTTPIVPMTEEQGATFILLSHSATACRLQGYPSLSASGAHGAIAITQSDGPQATYMNSAMPSDVTVPAGGQAYFEVAQVACQYGSTAAVATQLQITLPEGGGLLAPLALTAGAAGAIQVCSGEHAAMLSVSPIVASPEQLSNP